MTTSTAPRAQAAAGPQRRILFGVIAGLVVLGAIAADTTIVRIGSDNDLRKAAFSPETYGASEYPKIKANIEERAVDGLELAKAIAADKAEAGKKYGVAAGIGPVFPVRFTAVFGERKGNYHFAKVEGLPAEIVVRVQTGPALNGTDLRDATGTIQFGQFKNQIEYQDAGSALNNEVKKTVLSAIDVNTLSGKTVSVTGVFKLVNPKSWLVTPVRIDVQ